MKPIQTATLLLCAATSTAVAENDYALTNITGWTPAQLATLPHFDRYVPVIPSGATGDFTAVCSNGLGLVAGNDNTTSGDSAVDDGAIVAGGSQTNIGAWGLWSWHYSEWDQNHWDHYSGRVEQSPARAANILGQVLGYANLGGGSSEFATRYDYDDHIYLYDPATGEKTDLTPTAHRCDARDLNDRGEITGYWSDAAVPTNYHPFRRTADGIFIDLVFNEPFSHSTAPMLINNHGHVVGLVSIWKTPRIYQPFFSESGSTTISLPYPKPNPDLAKPFDATIADINDHGVIVGEYFKHATPQESTAIRWTKQGSNWVSEELVELLVDNFDFILDRALAVNDAGHIICSGHADGGPDDTWNTHRFLLTPVTSATLSPPAVTTLPATNVTSTGATLRAKINAADLPTTGDFQHGMSTGYGTDTPLSPLDGTLPSLAQLPLTGLAPHTTYHFRATATNSEGTTDGADESFTTAWDWTSWATANLGSTDPEADSNNNGLPDAIDYATGNAPPPTGTVVGDQLHFNFRRSLIADGVTIIVQVSDNMIIWNNGSSYSISSSTPDTAFTTELSRTPDGPDGESITIAIDATLPARFVRLKTLMP